MDPEQTAAVRHAMEGHMKLDSYGRTSIRNIYFDTPTYLQCRRSNEHPFYKEKLRLRSYGCPGPDTEVFVEIKKKYDGVVYKRRIEVPYSKALAWLLEGKDPGIRSQIKDELDYMLGFYKTDGGLHPAMGLDYMREAYRPVDKIDFRLTLDDSIQASVTDIDLTADGYGFGVLPEGYTLMEVKTPDTIPEWLTRCFSEYGIRKAVFSKYGTAYKQLVLGKTFYESTGLKTTRDFPPEECVPAVFTDRCRDSFISPGNR